MLLRDYMFFGTASVTLADALEALHIAAKMPVAIVIDEAQHAISTQQGIDAMFALKAARYHLNPGGPQPQKLFLVFTGSHQDKLSRLVQKNRAILRLRHHQISPAWEGLL